MSLLWKHRNQTGAHLPPPESLEPVVKPAPETPKPEPAKKVEAKKADPKPEAAKDKAVPDPKQ